MVSDPLELAAGLWRALPALRQELRLIGGLAARVHLGELARTTADVDIVAMTSSAATALIEHVEREGFVTGRTGGWWRVSLRGDVKDATVGGVTLSAVGASDLVILKLAAGRDQDLIDLMMLAAHAAPSAADVFKSIQADDIERTAAGNAVRARQALLRGQLDEVATDLLGRPASAVEKAAFVGFLDALASEGL